MTSKKIEPTDRMIRDVETWGEIMGVDDLDLMRYILNHPDARGLFECDHTDYVHVDEAATRVEAAHEKGWDDAAQHIYNKGWEGVTALRKANPHRTAPALPTEDGAVIIPADGHEYIVARVYNKTYRAREAVRHWAGGWHAAWRSGPEVRGVVAPEEITPGTWRTADDPR